MKKRNGYFPLLGFKFAPFLLSVFLALPLCGCVSGGDPIIEKGLVKLRDSHVRTIEKYNEKAAEHGFLPLDDDYKADVEGAYDDLRDYNKGVKPEAVRE